MPKKFVALIPLRGGSKSIPLKNIKLLAGKPLFFWAATAAVESDIFYKVYISTDSKEIAACVRKYFNESQISVITRDDHLATDDASTESVMIDFANNYDFTDICLIQATSPLTTPQDIKKALVIYQQDSLDSLFTATRFKRFLWDHDVNAVNHDFDRRLRRQDFKGQLMENGAFYFTRREVLLNKKNRLGGKIGYHIMPDETAIEIDEPTDWDIVDLLLQRKTHLSFKNSLKDIKAIIFDVDGTMTDAGMYYGKTGESLKKFNTRDAQGVALLKKNGLKIGVITGEDSPSVTSRMSKLDIQYYEKGISNKLPVFNKMAQTWGLDPAQVGYMGDDINDISCLETAGYSFCPQDATRSVRELVDFICSKKAGYGAVREVSDLIIRALSS